MRFHARRVIRNTAVILTILGVFKFQWWIGNEYPNSKPNNVFPKELTIFKNIKPTETTELPSRTSTIPTIKIIKKAKALLERKQNILILVYNQNGGVTKWVGALRDKCDVDMATREQCPLWKIELTYNKSRFAESDLVIFHALGGNMPNTDELRRLSKNRPLLQRWVYHSMESPKVTPMVSPLNGFFNATWTYRSDSDFSAAYATYVPLSPTEMSYKKVTISKRDYSKGKTSLVAWVVSNCSARLRNEFVAELMKYIDVHVYGSCSSNYNQTRVCNRGKMSKCLKKYKFYLSFENALCKDYITEKYWDRLGKEQLFYVGGDGKGFLRYIPYCLERKGVIGIICAYSSVRRVLRYNSLA
ncbi:glycoprotein 3-alpha-L-fucosyltransferase A [Nematostella vectensis]|uniref:glycoprotein 3-alpha-L-fucosyltransferase A n=1 Tax=Nematostella vectensis TaxID=45351 RepID=UPI0020775101|nr:glycoprotein 3-alpha-L-fucosyltransferase A [Nematostella vectensis]